MESIRGVISKPRGKVEEETDSTKAADGGRTSNLLLKSNIATSKVVGGGSKAI